MNLRLPSAPARVVAALAAACLSSACASVSSGGGPAGNARAAPPPETAAQRAAGSPAAVPGAPALTVSPGVMVASDLYVAYRVLLDTYVDPVDNRVLLNAAQDVLRQAVLGMPRLPLQTFPVLLAPVPSGRPDTDWETFSAAYSGVVRLNQDLAVANHLDWSLLRAMTGALNDNHTSFLTPEQVSRSADSTFAGIGVLVAATQDKSGPLVREVYDNTPAARAGLKSGDLILQVDGKDVTAMSIAEVANLIRGPAGSAVRLRVQHYQGQPEDVSVRRAAVQVPTATGRMLTSGGAYLRLRNFGLGAADASLGILQAGKARGAKAWVIDIRGNGGGSLQEVARLAGGLLPTSESLLGSAVDRAEQSAPLNATAITDTPPRPIVLLLDSETASGAEILASALQTYHAATLVGTKTAGSVAVATTSPLADGSALQVTQRRYRDPAGAPLDKVGVAPDVQVAISDQDLKAGRDPQLDRALAVLSGLVQQGSVSPAG